MLLTPLHPLPAATHEGISSLLASPYAVVAAYASTSFAHFAGKNSAVKSGAMKPTISASRSKYQSVAGTSLHNPSRTLFLSQSRLNLAAPVKAERTASWTAAMVRHPTPSGVGHHHGDLARSLPDLDLEERLPLHRFPVHV